MKTVASSNTISKITDEKDITFEYLCHLIYHIVPDDEYLTTISAHLIR